MELEHIKLNEGEAFASKFKMTGENSEFEIAIVCRNWKSEKPEYNMRYASKIGKCEPSTFESALWCGYAESLVNMYNTTRDWVNILI